jgi:hypothetical protein
VAVSFQGVQIVVHAAAELASGTPLLHCYGPQVWAESCIKKVVVLIMEVRITTWIISK